MTNPLFQKIIILLAFFTCSSIAIYSPIPASIFFITILLFTSLTLSLLKKNFFINKYIPILFIYIAINIILKSADKSESFSLYLQLLFSFFSFYFLCNLVDKKRILTIYIYFSLFISLIAIIQELGYFLNIKFLYDYSDLLGIANKKSYASFFLRVTSIFSEPAHLGFFLLIPIYLLFKNKLLLKFFPIPLAYILTFSIGNYIMLFLFFSFISIFIEKKVTFNKIGVVILFIFLIIILTIAIPEVNEKFNSIFINDDNLRDPKNGSMFAIYSLLIANIDALLENPIIGNGFGNRIQIYNLYMYDNFDLTPTQFKFYPDELFLAKYTGELGIVGLILLIGMIKIKWKKSSKIEKVFLFAFLTITLKSGSYYNPMLFFLLAFYLSNERKHEKNNNKV